MVSESVGEIFKDELLLAARDKTLAVIEAAAERTRPGVTEREAKALIKKLQAEHGCPQFWHPPQIRFGENTLQPFGKTGSGNGVLREEDIFFFDLGPLFEGHEGDVGRSYTVGHDAEMIKCAADTEVIFLEVRDHWRATGATGEALYNYAEDCAAKRGWILTTHGARGHRVADFPHAARKRGSIQGLESSPAANRWILEIQIRHPTRAFGAFFEDLLN